MSFIWSCSALVGNSCLLQFSTFPKYVSSRAEGEPDSPEISLP